MLYVHKLPIVSERTDQTNPVYNKTRKYPLRGYILGVLTHTTALDRLGEVMAL